MLATALLASAVAVGALMLCGFSIRVGKHDREGAQ